MDSSSPINPLALLFIAAFCLFGHSSLSAQEIVNPGFEDELSDWLAVGDRGMGAAVPEAAHSGQFGLRMTDDHPQKSGGVESLLSSAVPGKKYEISFWARTLSGDGALVVSLRFLDENRKGTQKKSPGVIVRSTPEWKRFTLVGTAPETTSGLCVRIHTLASEMVTADFDDLEVREIPQES